MHLMLRCGRAERNSRSHDPGPPGGGAIVRSDLPDSEGSAALTRCHRRFRANRAPKAVPILEHRGFPDFGYRGTSVELRSRGCI